MAKSTMYQATFAACNELTKTFDMIWPIDGALWCFKQEIIDCINETPDISDAQLKIKFFQTKYIHGLNFRRTALELSWDEQERYIAKLLLVNITSIYDAWVDSIIDSAFSSLLSKKKKIKICDGMKMGDFSLVDIELAGIAKSALLGCFKKQHILAQTQLSALTICYKYFKSCRNCCAHGDVAFSPQAERDYIPYAPLIKTDLGLPEKPASYQTVAGQPFEISLRGVVGFTHVIYKIMRHYDCALSDCIGIDDEIEKKWRAKAATTVRLKSRKDKRNAEVRNRFSALNTCPPLAKKTDVVYLWLKSKRLVF